MSIPKISVIIPIYNTEKYLDKCIDSVRQQTFTDIEIICVDDCSPDNSAAVVEKHLSEDNRIIFIRHKKNIGLGGARNSAIRIAKGEYLASADSDDYMQSNMLEKLWQATDNETFDVVSCGFNRVDEMGNILSYSNNKNKQIKKDDIKIFKSLNPAFCNKLWRKSLYVDNQIYFPLHDYYEDMSTTPRILSKVNSINVINDRLYNYQIRSDSITGSYGDKQIIDYFKGFEILFNFLIESDLYDQYEDSYHEYVKNNVFYHAKGVLSADLYIEEKKQYLRNLLFLRVGFQENFSRIKNNDIDSLIAMHSVDKPSYYFEKYEEGLRKISHLNERLDRQNELYLQKQLDLQTQQVQLQKKLEVIVSEKLTFKQEFWVIVFGFVSRLSLTDRQYLKLKKTPKKFFRDSSNKYARKYSLFFRIIDK